MAVRRVDAGAQPQPGIREPDLHVGHRRGEPARRVVLGTDRPLAVRPSSAPSSRRRPSQGSARAWSWLPGTSTSVRPASAAPSASTSGAATSSALASGRSRSSRRVTQQHDPVVSTDRVDEPLAHARVAGHVRPAERAEMQVETTAVRMREMVAAGPSRRGPGS